MINEIDKDFYCSASFYQNIKVSDSGTGYCRAYKRSCGKICSAFHRKYPTPEQYKEEYGRELPDDFPVYALLNGSWQVTNFFTAKEDWFASDLVCACTPFGKPDRDWRPE